MLLARRRLPPRIRARLTTPCCRELRIAHRPAAAAAAAVCHIAPTIHSPRALVPAAYSPLPRLSLERGGSRLSGNSWNVGGVRYISVTNCRRAAAANAKVAHGARTGTPAIPSFIEIRELATLLRVKPRALFKSLGGYLEKKKHRIVLSGVPYAFPNLGNVVVPFQDVRAVTKVLGKEIRFLDVDKKPKRAALVVPSGSRASLWEEGRHDGLGRRPVVVLLGHFNHGKTTILDALLGPNSGIAEREAGGITQEIRARTVSLEAASGGHLLAGAETAPTVLSPPPGETTNLAGNEIAAVPASTSNLATIATFLDTPGQEIFYRMRTNGARVADAVVLVVSAVDGVCLQTSESIGCAEELGLPVVVVLNKIDLLPEEEAAQRVKDLTTEVGEFVAIQNAQVLPVSAHTGSGLGDLRASLAIALSQQPSPSEHPLSVENKECSGSETSQRKDHSPLADPVDSSWAAAATDRLGTSVSMAAGSGEGVQGFEVVEAEAPGGAAAATVLDYTSSAKTGKVLLVLVDKGVLRPGDWFVSGMLWGVVRSIYDEEGNKLLEHAGPGVAVMVVVVARTRVSNAPLGEPFRVLTKEAAEKVAHARALARTIDTFVDHYRLERDFPHLLDNEDDDDESKGSVGEKPRGPKQLVVGQPGETDGGGDGTHAPAARERADSAEERLKLRRQKKDEEEYLNPEDMPVTIVVKANSANTLTSILDALGDWGEVESFDDGGSEKRGTEMLLVEEVFGGRSGDGLAGNGKNDEEGAPELLQPLPRRQEFGEGDLQHKQRRKLLVSVARSGVGAVTTSDVRLARDCECPVFAHNVKADASAIRELKRVGGAVLPAMPEGAVGAEETGVGVGGQEGFVGRAGEGRECVVVSETVGELLGEIERFVLRVR
ncbi:unnamed protein product [Pylaiella littoralis]